MDSYLAGEDSHVDALHEIGVRLANADGFHDVLARVVEFASGLVKCDSCLVYVLEGEELVLVHKGQRSTARVVPEKYHTLKAVSHVPLAIYVLLLPLGCRVFCPRHGFMPGF